MGCAFYCFGTIYCHTLHLQALVPEDTVRKRLLVVQVSRVSWKTLSVLTDPEFKLTERF